MTPTWQENSSIGVTPAATPTVPQIKVDPVTPSNDVAQIVSSCNSSLVGGDVTQNHSQLISKAISSTVQQCLDISSLSHASSSTVDSSNVNVTKNLQSSVNGHCTSVSSDVSNVRVYGANSKTISLKNCQPNVNNEAETLVTNVPEYKINETFTFDKILDGVYPLKVDEGSSLRQILGDRTNSIQNADTITKERPSVEVPVVNSNTITKTTVNSGTVTKNKAYKPNVPKDMIKVIQVAGLKECSTPPNDRSTSVVRAFNFEGMPCPSPAGRCAHY